MKIFLSGSTGQIGKNLLSALRQHHDVYCYRRGEDIAYSVKDFNPDIIYHLAGETSDETKMVASNFELTRDLVEASNSLDYTAFVYIGTSSEYGIKTKPMKEDDTCEPTTLYAKTKHLGTEICQFYARLLNKNIMIVRPFSVYGTGEKPNRFFPMAIRACLEDKVLECWTGSHDWVHVEDLVLALMMLPYKKLPGEIINIGTGISYRNIEVIRLIEDIVGKLMNLTRHNVPRRKTDSKVWVANNCKAMSLGWKPTVKLEDGLKREIEEIKNEKK